MPRSMTAFTRQFAEFEWGALVWEIRSVNHRFLDPSIKMPEFLRNLEGKVRELLRKSINRGKVDAQLRLTINPAVGKALSLNESFLGQLIQTESALREQLAAASTPVAPANPLELLKWPGILQEQEQNTKTIEEQTLILFGQALDDLQASREREGEALDKLIRQRLDSISSIIADIRQAMPDILARQRQKLQETVTELASELDPTRLEQEIVLLAQKADIFEEVDRLETHTAEVKRVLTDPKPIGRKLDFLMQELNREANTICSKAIVTDTTHGAVELKVLIEQMREQIQNIE